MINLLPKKEKQRIAFERKKNLVIIFWFLVLYFFICLGLVLFLVKIFLNSQIEPQKIHLEEKRREIEKEKIEEIQKRITRANAGMKRINSFYENKIYYTEILEKISEIMPEGIYLNTLSLSKSVIEKEEVISFSVTGHSPDVDLLVVFRDNLKKEEKFKDLYIPSSSWINPQSFSIFFKL